LALKTVYLRHKKSAMITIQDINFKDKKALVRVDFNVPLNKEFEVTDPTRIQAAKPTILKILNDGGSCVLMSHLGRPKGKEEAFSLHHIVDSVSNVLGVPVLFVSDCVGDTAESAAANLKPGEVLLLENLRYYKEETAGDSQFAKRLSQLGDVYVNDAFGCAHRAHASTAIITENFPKDKCFGALLASEIRNLEKVLGDSKKPVTAVIGGAKVSSKITVIKSILDKVNHLVIGGGMAFTFVKAQGGNIGSSLVEDDKQTLALQILKLAKEKGVEVHLPVDVIAADQFSKNATTQISSINHIPQGWMGLDAGPQSNHNFEHVLLQSNTILWNGPVGVFEMPLFSKGTRSLANAIAKATHRGAFSLVGGGDSVAAVKQFNMSDKVSYVSTGGGAMLEMLEGKTLPGIQAIID